MTTPAQADEAAKSFHKFILTNRRVAPGFEWKDIVPHSQSSLCISIFCGNSRYHWALHKRNSTDFSATLFWRTTAVMLREINSDVDPCSYLDRYIPDHVKKQIYGNAPSGRMAAVQNFHVDRVPFFNVYIVSTNKENELGLEFILQKLPCRLVYFDSSHFFESDLGFYDTLGTDRVANLKAAMGTYGAPALVIDGGTAWTWTAADKDGKFMGGGILSGMDVTAVTLSSNTNGALPYLDVKTVTESISNYSSTDTCVPAYANNTETAILSGIWQEKRAVLLRIIQSWLERVNGGVDGNVRGNCDFKFNSELKVVVTGGDAMLITKLIESNTLVDRLSYEPDFSDRIETRRHLSHGGISALLKQYTVPPEQMTPTERLRHTILGQRVAKVFSPGKGYYVGTITSIKRTAEDSIEDDLFKVDYDDGDLEELNCNELYIVLTLYVERGETYIETDRSRSLLQKKKREEAEEVAKLLEKHSAGAKAAAAGRATKTAEELCLELASTPEADPVPAGRKRTVTPRQSTNTKKTRTEAADIAAGIEKTKVRKSTDKKATNRKSVSKKQKISIDSCRMGKYKDYEGLRLCKYFGKNLFYGTIVEFSPKEENDTKDNLWRAIYDDEDVEDYAEDELLNYLREYIMNHTGDKKKTDKANAYIEKVLGQTL